MLQTISLFAPQLLLAVTASLLLGFGVSKDKDRSILVRYIAVGLLVLFAFIGLILGQPSGEAFKGALLVNNFSHYVNCLLYTSPSPRDRG